MNNMTKMTVFQGTNPQHRNYIMQRLLGGVPDSYNLYPFKQRLMAPSCLTKYFQLLWRVFFLLFLGHLDI